MEQAERNFHKSFTFDEVNQINLDISYVQEVLGIVFVLNEPVNEEYGQTVTAIVHEARDKMDRIQKMLDRKE